MTKQTVAPQQLPSVDYPAIEAPTATTWPAPENPKPHQSLKEAVTRWENSPSAAEWGKWSQRQDAADLKMSEYHSDLERRLMSLLRENSCEPNNEGWRKLAIILAMKHDHRFRVNYSDISSNNSGKTAADIHFHIDGLFAAVASAPEGPCRECARKKSSAQHRVRWVCGACNALFNGRLGSVESRTASHSQPCENCQDMDTQALGSWVCGECETPWTPPSGRDAAEQVRRILQQEEKLYREHGLPHAFPRGVPSAETLRVEHGKRLRSLRTNLQRTSEILPASQRKLLRLWSVLSELLVIAGGISGRHTRESQLKTSEIRQD